MTVRGAGLIGACAAFGMPRGAGRTGRRHAVVLAARGTCTKSDPSHGQQSGMGRSPHAAHFRSVSQPCTLSCRCPRGSTGHRRRGCGLLCAHWSAWPALLNHHGTNQNGAPLNILTTATPAGWPLWITVLLPRPSMPHTLRVSPFTPGSTKPSAQPGRQFDRLGVGPARVPHTLIADNAGGHLMQHGQVDLVITGADRVTRQGDVANKIGTYLSSGGA